MGVFVDTDAFGEVISTFNTLLLPVEEGEANVVHPELICGYFFAYPSSDLSPYDKTSKI